MRSGRALRLAGVAVTYAGAAFLLDVVVLRALVPLLVLPAVFLDLARGLLVLGFAGCLAAAWVYERPTGDPE